MNIKKTIGIISCKGGVGKSTLSVNLAIALSHYYKKKVGLLDADIYGPNHPTMLGLKKLENNINDQILHPKIKFGIKSMSMGYFLKDNTPVLLRGPMISNTIKYLYTKTHWEDLDFLVVDFPPGTGDIYLSLLRDITFDGVYLITTPQIISIDDIKRSIGMLTKFNIEIVGILENMKYYYCNSCKSINNIFGDNTEFLKLLNEFNIKNIYTLPFDNLITTSINSGIPFIVSNPDTEISQTIKKMSNNLIIK